MMKPFARLLVEKSLSAVLTISLLVLSQNGCTQSNSGNSTGNAPKRLKIGIVYTEPHPVLNTIIDSFKARVTESIPDVEFIERHGNGSKAQFPATVRGVIAENVDLLAPITTPMSVEALTQAGGRIPVVFLGVTDPVGAGLVNSLDSPGKCSGVSDNPPMDGVIDLVRQFMPNAKSIGIPYDPKDQPGVTTAQRAAEAAKARGFQADLRPVASENELRAAVRGLSTRHDALVIGMDNLMMKNAGIISQTAMDQRRPLFAADDKSVEMGAVAGVGVDYADVGQFGADIAVKVLKDKQPVGDIPVQSLKTGQRFINDKAAQSLNLTIPPESKPQAKAVGQ
jgi:putative ABC transport system substrate-binding protein